MELNVISCRFAQALIFVGIIWCGSLIAQETSRKTPSAVDPETGLQTVITISPETTFIVEPLDEVGFPDYIAFLNERGKTIKPEENAAVDLARIFGLDSGLEGAERVVYCHDAAKLMGVTEDSDVVFEETYKDYIEQLLKRRRVSDQDYARAMNELMMSFGYSRGWKRERHPELYDWISKDSNVKTIAMLEAMSEKKEFYWPSIVPMRKTQILPNVWYAYANNLYGGYRVLQTSTMLDMGEGRYKDALRKFAAVHRLAELQSRQESLIEKYVAYQMNSSILYCEMAFVQDPEVPLEIVVSLQKQLWEVKPTVGIIESFANYLRECQLAQIVFIAKNWKYEGKPLIEAVREISTPSSETEMIIRCSAMLPIGFDEALRRTNKRYDEIQSWSELTGSQRYEKAVYLMDLWESEAKSLSPLRVVLGYIFGGREYRGRFLETLVSCQSLSGPGSLLTLDDQLQMKFELADVAISMERYFRAHGEYPDDLDDLVPEYISKIPVDRFSEAPLIYELVDGEYRLSSVGVSPSQVGKVESGVSVASPGWMSN